MSLQDKIYNWLRKQPMVWVSSVQIEKVVSKNTKHSGSYASRQCRLLAEEKLLEREERSVSGKVLAYYRFNPKYHGPTLSLQSAEWFDALPCCSKDCQGGRFNTALCKTLHP